MNRFLLLLSLVNFAFTEQAHPVQAPCSSRVLAFRCTSIMDTVTAILYGRVVGLGDQQPVPTLIQLTTATATFRVHATPDGNFQFFHIPAGDYLLTATHPAFSPLKCAPVHLGTGDAAVTTIGLALLPTAKK